MFDCHAQLLSYFCNRVRLTEAQKDVMRERRDANQRRLARGLAGAGKPLPLYFVKQGSYAMHTMVQSEMGSSDIDDGAVFAKEDLVGERGAGLSALQARQRVRDAIYDRSFKQAPEVRNKCVRVYYNDGFTVDVPVYRATTDALGNLVLELAATDWIASDPKAVTEWFNTQVTDKSPDRADGCQMRRLVRLLKAWSKSRSSWSLPSGFILSVLTDENYPHQDSALQDRDDKALVTVMEAIASRLAWNLTVAHPVVPGTFITKSAYDANMVQLRQRLDEAVRSLAPLRRSDCNELVALKAWRTVLATDYFDARIDELERAEQEAAKARAAQASGGPEIVTGGRSEPAAPFDKRGHEGRYA